LPAEDIREKISFKAGGKFALIIDGWSCDAQKFVATLASLPDDEDQTTAESVLLGRKKIKKI
jgi:hypothetical protein